MEMFKQPKDSGSGGDAAENDEESTLSPDDDDTESTGASAAIGDHVQWESQGVLQFNEPRRVRWISPCGEWVAVEGSETGIPMDEVTIEQKAAARTPPIVPAEVAANISAAGFTEWFRAKVGPDKLVTINYKGAEEIGPREIEKMIAILEAQKLALED